MIIHKSGNKTACAAGRPGLFEASHLTHGKAAIFSFCVPTGSTQGGYYRVSMSREEAVNLIRWLHDGLTMDQE